MLQAVWGAAHWFWSRSSHCCLFLVFSFLISEQKEGILFFLTSPQHICSLQAPDFVHMWRMVQNKDPVCVSMVVANPFQGRFQVWERRTMQKSKQQHFWIKRCTNDWIWWFLLYWEQEGIKLALRPDLKPFAAETPVLLLFSRWLVQESLTVLYLHRQLQKKWSLLIRGVTPDRRDKRPFVWPVSPLRVFFLGNLLEHFFGWGHGSVWGDIIDWRLSETFLSTSDPRKGC